MSNDEFRRTHKYADMALKQLKQTGMAAYPRNYELLFTYASGTNQGLNKAVNEILRTKKVITPEDLEAVFECFLSPARFNDRVEEVGSQMSAELNAVISSIAGAADISSSYAKSLAGASRDLSKAGDKDQIQAIVGTLLTETRNVEARNRELESRLAESRKQIDSLQDTLETVRNESLTDALTSLSNRKFFDSSMTRLLEQAMSSNQPFSLLMADVDHFKKFNDTYGHQTGDQVLRLVAQAIKYNVKGRDVAARYGGEEFAILLPETIGESALRVAENVRVGVMGKDLVKRSTGEKLGRVTISIGVAAWRTGDTAQTLMERADSALYLAKHNGRNRVQCETDLDSSVEVA